MEMFYVSAGAISELIARWITQNLLEVRTVIGATETKENLDESMTDLSDAEWAAEADKLSVGSSEEAVIIQGIITI